MIDNLAGSFRKVRYDGATEGNSFAEKLGKWSWTSTPTPGSENKINLTLASTKISTVSKYQNQSVKGAISNLGSAPITPFSITESDRFFGRALIGVATFLAVLYTGYINKDLIIGKINKIRGRNNQAGPRLRSKK
jgi:hypothetical protein